MLKETIVFLLLNVELASQSQRQSYYQLKKPDGKLALPYHKQNFNA
jgi:hypothetical protein